MRPCLKKNNFFFILILSITFTMLGCAKYSLIKEQAIYIPTLEQEAIRIDVKPFFDIRPKEEREGLTEETKRMLSFASSDEHFKEEVAEAITKRMVSKLQASGFQSRISDSDMPFKGYILSGKIKHFQVVIQLPGITFVPYLGTAASVFSKDEFNIAVSIEATLEDTQTNEVLLSRSFDVSEDLKLPVGLFSLARLGRGRSHRFKLLDEALNDVLDQIVREISAVAHSSKAASSSNKF